MTVLTPETVEEIFGKLNLPFRFTANERTRLIATPVVDLGERVLGFPTPGENQGLNLLTLRSIVGVSPQKQPSFFDHPWYLIESFGSIDCEAGWHFLQMEPPPDTIEQPYNYFASLNSAGWTLPSAVEVVLMLFLYYVRTGEQLLLKKHTWCRDQATLGRAVTVGAFGRNGVFISGHPPGFSSRGLGICGKFKNQPSGEPSR